MSQNDPTKSILNDSPPLWMVVNLAKFFREKTKNHRNFSLIILPDFGSTHCAPQTVILQLLSVQHANDFNTLVAVVFEENVAFLRGDMFFKTPKKKETHIGRLKLKCLCKTFQFFSTFGPLEG